MISVDEALARVLARVPLLEAESIPLAEAAGRVLRAPARADRDLPPFNRAAMDGFALRARDVTEAGGRLPVTADIRAGVWPGRPLGEGEAFRIMTGAPLPVGADAVIQVEKTRMDGEHVVLDAVPEPGQNFVPRGAEARAGDALLPEGERLSGAALAVLASCGVVTPLVSKRPRVALLVTGDEVIDPAHTPEGAQIRNANGPALAAAIHAAGGIVSDLGIVRDDAEATRALLSRVFEDGFNAVVLSGGVSAGDFDFVEPALLALGAELHVTAVRVKPGAPFVFGTRGDTLIFGLPGNPVSAQVTFELFARPALLKAQGARRLNRPFLTARLDGVLRNRSGRRNYLPVAASFVDGELRARPLRSQGSGDIAAHAHANALVILEPDRTSAREGERVPLYPLPSLLEVS